MRRRDRDLSIWADACELIDQAERLNRRFFQPTVERHPAWRPPLDVFETEDSYVLCLALPGVPPDAVEILVEPDALTVVGIRPPPVDAGTVAVHRIEVPHGRFERRIELPRESVELGHRDLVDGCLRITLRKLR